MLLDDENMIVSWHVSISKAKKKGEEIIIGLDIFKMPRPL